MGARILEIVLSIAPFGVSGAQVSKDVQAALDGQTFDMEKKYFHTVPTGGQSSTNDSHKNFIISLVLTVIGRLLDNHHKKKEAQNAQAAAAAAPPGWNPYNPYPFNNVDINGNPYPYPNGAQVPRVDPAASSTPAGGKRDWKKTEKPAEANQNNHGHGGGGAGEGISSKLLSVVSKIFGGGGGSNNNNNQNNNQGNYNNYPASVQTMDPTDNLVPPIPPYLEDHIFLPIPPIQILTANLFTAPNFGMDPLNGMFDSNLSFSGSSLAGDMGLGVGSGLGNLGNNFGFNGTKRKFRRAD